jgi:glycosyltransferase involved in cell wall biosynthesis
MWLQLRGERADMPLVSVITPVYNAARWLPETIASVQAQTLTDWELILVDDGSTDESVAIAEKAAKEDSRIRSLRMPANGGPGAARNMALDAAQGRFIAFIDADDLWLPEKLSTQTVWMTEHHYEFVYHDYRNISQNKPQPGLLIFGPDILDMRTLHIRRGVGCLTVMIDRQLIPDFKFAQGFRRYLHEDFMTWLWLIRKNIMGHRLPIDLARYRLVETSLSADKFESAQRVWRIYREVSNLSLWLSVFWWMQYAQDALCRRCYRMLRERSI